MADFSTLIASIEETIKTNGVQAITGQILQDEMLLMVSAINQLKQDTLEGYAFYGQVLADGGSASVTQNTFFLVTAGTYTINGNTFTVTGEGVSVVVYDSVNDEVLNEGLILPFDNAPISGSTNPITSGAVAAALAENPANFAACLYDRRSAGTPQSPYTFRQSSGDGVDYLKRIKGRTLVWNQLVQNGDFSDDIAGWDAYRATATFSDGVAKITPTAADNTAGFASPIGTLKWIEGHKYLFFALVKGTSGVEMSFSAYYGGIAAPIRITASGNWEQLSGIVTAGSTMAGYAVLRVAVVQAADANLDAFYVRSVFCVDLTLLGWVPSSVSEFSAVYPLSYYSYTPALLINNAATDLESTGSNQWDEEWEGGSYNYDTGEKENSTSAIEVYFRSANAIKVFPNTTYCFTKIAGQSCRVFEYDSVGNYIGYSAPATVYAYNLFTTRSNTHTIRFYASRETFNICINISDPSRNGTYEPYWKATRHLGLDNLQAKEVGSDTIVTINGLDGVGDNVDLLKEGKYIEKNRARVDLGDLAWGYSPAGCFYATVPSLLNQTSGAATLLCPAYATDANANTTLSGMTDKTVRHVGTSIGIKDSNAGTDPAAFKAAMAGVILDYPLATPKEYELVEPIQPMLEVDELGTERRLPEDTADAVNAPFESDSNYSVSVANLVRKLSE